jgi:HlyD family secretion protein
MTLRLRYIVSAALALLLVLAYWARAPEKSDGGYLVEPVERGEMVATVTATGTVNPVTTVQVGTYVSGPILAIDVDFNSPVRKGQRVAKIDPASFVVKVQRAEANLANALARVEKASADLQLKRLTWQRQRELRAGELVSQNDLDTAKSDHEQARAQVMLDEAGVKQAEAELAEARINLGYTDITSPVDGVVVSRNVDVGQTVAASFQTPTLFQIAQDLTKMQVSASVSESDIGSLNVGQAATFTVDAFPGQLFRGLVTQVRNAPVTVLNVVTYDVIIAVDNSRLQLRPGMTATVVITTAERHDVLQLPIRALSFAPPGSATGDGQKSQPRAQPPEDGQEPEVVWRLANGTLEPVQVETGLRDERSVEVLSGDLQPGDEVAVGLRQSATPRAAVRPFGMPRVR